jgi:hypothetical protein
MFSSLKTNKHKKKTPWPQSANELYRPSNRRLSAKLVPTFAVRGVAWSAQQIPTAVNLGFLDRSRYFFTQFTPQLSSRVWVDPVPDSLLLRKSGRAGNQTRDLWICNQKLWPLDHISPLIYFKFENYSAYCIYLLGRQSLEMPSSARNILLTYLRKELSPSWEVANCAAIQKIPSIFKEPEG